MANNDLVRSVLRSFKILGLVAQSERGMTLQEICDLLQYNKSTTYSLVRTLIARNFLERTAAPVRYRLGRAAVELGDEVARHELDRRAEQTLKRLHEDIAALLPSTAAPPPALEVGFAQQIGTEIRLVQRIGGDAPLTLERPMSIAPAYASLASLIHQLYWSQEERAMYRARHPLVDDGAAVWRDEAELDAYLRTIRGQACAALDAPPGMQRVAAPIFGRGGTLTAVLEVVVHGPVSRLVQFRMQRCLREHAAALAPPAGAASEA